MDVIRGSKSIMCFDSNTKHIREKFMDGNLEAKVQGLEELMVVLGKCCNLEDQLNVYSAKAQALLKELFASLKAQETESNPFFDDFVDKLKEILGQTIFETHQYIYGVDDGLNFLGAQKQLYVVDFHSE